jgi:hypothetical protein
MIRDSFVKPTILDQLAIGRIALRNNRLKKLRGGLEERAFSNFSFID